MENILHIGFGYEPYWSGGMVFYQIDLMRELVGLGYNIIFYTAGRYDLRKRPYLARRKVSGIKTIEIVNSPNYYDPYCYRTNPMNHCSNALVEKMTEDVIVKEKPNLIHLHDLRMHSSSTIAIARKFKVPMIKTIHNFWDLCPKDDLLYNNAEPCVTFEGGKRCVRCLRSYSEDKIPISHQIKGAIKYGFLVKFCRRNWNVARKILPPRKTNGTLDVGFSANLYGMRRKYMMNTLNLCDVIHTTSSSCAEKLRSYGVNGKIIKIIPLSTRTLSQIETVPSSSIHYPIRFGYRGFIHKRKGIDVLLSAFSRLDQNKCKLIIYGFGDNDILQSYCRSGLNIEYKGRYGQNQIQESMEEIDVGIVPSIWEEPFGIVGLEYLNAKIPVIASNIGGITEWLRDGENGYFFRPGDIEDLRRTMKRLVDNPELITSMRLKIKPWKTIEKHAREIDLLYRTLLAQK